MSTSTTLLQPGRYYHIYSHAVGNADLFQDDSDYRHFLTLLANKTPETLQLLCYCLLRNHFHLLGRIKSIPACKPHLALSHALNAYTQYFNRRHGRTGTLFRRPFQRKEITDERYLARLVGYIHANPVHHGITTDLSTYRWSSYRTMLCDKPTLLSRNETLAALGGRMSFITYHQQYADHLMDEWTLEQTP